MGKYYWIVDIDRCIGCETCVVACMQEQNTLPGIEYRKLYIVNPELYPDYPIYRLSIACNHCEEPACLNGCPVNAYEIKDGIVIHDQKKCIGCKYCVWVCPYNAPQFSSGKNKAEKCDLCKDRLSKGLEPACVTSCPTQALKLIENLNEDNLDMGEKYMTHLPGFPPDRTGIKLKITGMKRLKFGGEE